MTTSLVALLWVNIRVRWREWWTSEADGELLHQMRGLWAAEVIRPRPYRTLRLVRSNPRRGHWTVRRVA